KSDRDRVRRRARPRGRWRGRLPSGPSSCGSARSRGRARRAARARRRRREAWTVTARWSPAAAFHEDVEVTAQATFCATLVDEWIRAGITHAVIAPGSRSTPLTLALAARPELRVHVAHDERVAGFCGLGIALVTGHPAVVLTTSGTAATHLHG